MGIFQIKMRAKAALRGHWQTALLIALIVSLPSLLIQGIFASVSGGEDVSGLADLLLYSLMDSGSGSLAEQLRTVSVGAGVWLMPLLTLLAWLVLTPFMELGRNHWMLDRLRGAEDPISAVFSRAGIFFKSVGLRLALSLRVLLWALPGLALCVLSLVLLFTAEAPSAPESISALSAGAASGVYSGVSAGSSAVSSAGAYSMGDLFPLASLCLLIFYMGLAGMAVLGFMSWLRFSQASFILADEPDESVSSCLSRSRQLMGRRKGSFIGLIMSFAPLYLFVVFGSFYAGALLGSVIGTFIQMLGTMAVGVSVLSARGAYYENLRESLSAAPVQAAEGSSVSGQEEESPADQPSGDADDSALNDSSDAE